MRSSLNEKGTDIGRVRLKRWFAPILDEAGWRSNLVDAQAEQLLQWGLVQVEQTAVRSQTLPDEDADPLLEKDSTAVRLIMTILIILQWRKTFCIFWNPTGYSKRP